MQRDVGNEPYLSTAQALCLFISHILSITSQSTEYRVQTDRQTESDTYEPTVQLAQVGSINTAFPLKGKIGFLLKMENKRWESLGG